MCNRVNAWGSRNPLRIIDEEVVDLSRRVYVVLAQIHSSCHPVQQAIGEHQIMGQVRIAIKGLGQVLSAVRKLVG